MPSTKRASGARPSTWPRASSPDSRRLRLCAQSWRWPKVATGTRISGANAESVGLLMAHCRNAKAFLHCSSAAVYDPPDDEPRSERAALGDNHKPLFPTYSISKIAGEVVARTMARALELPTIIARLNVPYGDNGGWPFYHMEMILAGMPIPVPAGVRPATTQFTKTTSSRRSRSCSTPRQCPQPQSTGVATKPSACRTGVATSVRSSGRNRSSKRARKLCAATQLT